MNDAPFALLITWTCYGTWLPGDRRGHVSNFLSSKGDYQKRQNEPGTPIKVGDSRTRERAQALQKFPGILLSCEEAHVVAESLIKTAEVHRWTILRAAVMSNHVHVVVCRCPNDGAAVRRRGS